MRSSEKPRPGNHIVRAAVASFLAHFRVASVETSTPVHADDAEAVASKIYAGDGTTKLLLRAAVDPMALSGSPLAAQAVLDFIGNLGGISAASRRQPRSLAAAS